MNKTSLFLMFFTILCMGNEVSANTKANEVIKDCEWKFDIVEKSILRVSCHSTRYSTLIPSDISFILYNGGWHIWTSLGVREPSNAWELSRNYTIRYQDITLSGMLHSDAQKTKPATFKEKSSRLKTRQVQAMLQHGFSLVLRADKPYASDFSFKTQWPAEKSQKIIKTLEDFRKHVKKPYNQ